MIMQIALPGDREARGFAAVFPAAERASASRNIYRIRILKHELHELHESRGARKGENRIMRKIDEIWQRMMELHRECPEGKSPAQVQREAFELLDLMVENNAEFGRICSEAKRKMDPREYRDFLLESEVSAEMADAAIDIHLRLKSGEKKAALYALTVELAMQCYQVMRLGDRSDLVRAGN